MAKVYIGYNLNGQTHRIIGSQPIMCFLILDCNKHSQVGSLFRSFFCDLKSEENYFYSASQLLFFLEQGSTIVLVRSYLRVLKTAGQVNILIFLVKIRFSLCMPINFVVQGKCLFSDISRPVEKKQGI